MCSTTKMRSPAKIIYAFIVFLLYANFQHTYADRKPCHNCEIKKRNVDHMDEILLRPDPLGYDDNDPTTKAVLKGLERIYQNMIKPVEQQFRYADLRRHTMSEVDIYAKPLILLVGPWSTGKSTMINYLLGIEGALESLYVGAEPTTGDFTVVSHGDEYRTVEGVVLATDPTQPFASMEKFGQIFLEHLLGVELNTPLLRNISFIDTPGILENRRQQERGYPYNDVMRWLVHRSDLIFVVFDPTKLDVGWELESLFKQLKGKESVLRIILNKADSISEQDLIRVYGALFWSLSPLINVTEPPRVYVGSFWGEPYQDEEMGQVLLREEKSLLHDMREVIRNRVYNKIAFLRQYAVRVRIHALLVDSYVTAYRRNKGLFGNGEELARKIVENPEDYDVFKTVLSHPNISKYDLPEPEEYQEFFRINPLSDQRRISEHCGYFSGCAIDQLNQAISTDLPTLLRRFQNPNERSRLHQKRPFNPMDLPNIVNSKDQSIRLETVLSGGSVASEDSKPTGAKKYRKSAKVDQKIATPEQEDVEVQSVKQSKTKRGMGGDAKADAVKNQPKRRRQPKERSASHEETPPVKIEKPVEVEDDENESAGSSATTEPPPPTHKPGRTVTSGAKKSKTDSTQASLAKAKKDASSKKAPREASREKPSRKVTPSATKVPRKENVKKKGESAEAVGHKGTTVSKEDGTKCNKYRKSCSESSPAENPAPKSKDNKPIVEERKKPTSVKPAQPSVVPQNPSPKCNKYRKSCQTGQQNGDSHSHSAERHSSQKPPAQVAPPETSSETGIKCTKYSYRKSCQHSGASSESDQKKSIVKKGPESPKTPAEERTKQKKGDQPEKEAAASPTQVKCGKYSYRKSCQEGESAEISEPVKAKDHHADQREKESYSAETTEVKCTKYSYRLSCRDKEDGENEATEQPKKKPNRPAAVEQNRVPALKNAKIVKEREHDRRISQSQVPDETANLNLPGNGVKCNKYRKSCQDALAGSASKSSHHESSKSAPSRHGADEIGKPAKLASNDSPDPGVPCNKYRKSCQAAMKDAGKEKAVDKGNDAKQKKPCKKKNTTTNPQSKQTQTNFDNTKQNKWRKQKPSSAEQHSGT